MNDSIQKKKPSKLKKFAAFVFLFGGGLVVLGALMEGSNNLPSCESSDAKSTLSEAFNNSQFARMMSLGVVEVYGTKTITSSPELNTCEASITLNNAQSVDVSYRLEKRSDGMYMLTFEVKD